MDEQTKEILEDFLVELDELGNWGYLSREVISDLAMEYQNSHLEIVDLYDILIQYSS